MTSVLTHCPHNIHRSTHCDKCEKQKMAANAVLAKRIWLDVLAAITSHGAVTMWEGSDESAISTIARHLNGVGR